MVSEKQLTANRKNALMGGVKTEQGKKKSRMNAIKYGFFSRLITKFDKLDHKEFCDEIYTYFSPQNVYERQLIEILLANLLAIRRIFLVENELFKKALDPIKNISDFEDLFIEKKGYKPQVEENIIEVMDKICRYRTTIFNMIIKTQHELERLQSLRKSEKIPSSLAIDVNVAEN